MALPVPTATDQDAMPLSAPPPRLPPGACLFLDFDGTLVELAETPDAIVVGDGMRALLERLAAALDGRVALVSGRSVAQLDAFLHPARVAAVAGSHGGERRYADGRSELPGAPDAFAPAAQAAHAFAAERPGLLVEEKSFGVTLHYRLAPHHEPDTSRFARQLAEAHGLHLQGGKMMVDLRLPGADKGDAVRAMMAQPGWAAGVPLFVGDDLTDEDGFAAARELGGAGVLVGPERATAASHRLSDVAAVHRWLGETCEGPL